MFLNRHLSFLLCVSEYIFLLSLRLMFDVENGHYMITVMVAWIILRTLSFSLDFCDSDPDNDMPVLKQAQILLGYCLYFPMVFMGPFMQYSDFHTGLNNPARSWNLKRVINSIVQLVRYSVWTALTNFLLYSFYAHSVQSLPHLIIKLNSWSMAGFVYYLICFFCLKYNVLYGFPGVFSSMEGYKPPPPPRCAMVCVKFSYIWRKFDFGLYTFMRKYIYKPWIQTHGFGMITKLQGTALVFTFVYIWHGVHVDVMLWAFFNFIGIVIEKLADQVCNSSRWLKFEEKFLSPRMSRRVYALFSMFLFVPLLISLAIFLSSTENARVICNRVFLEGFPRVTLTTGFLLYCQTQIGFEVHNWNIQKGKSVTKAK